MSNYAREKLLFYPAKLSLYGAIFQHLDLSLIKEQMPKTGRRLFSRQSICRALIYKNLKAIETLAELAFELSANLGIAYILGFDKQPPSRRRFEEFLHKLPNQLLQEIRRQRIKTLIGLGVISGKYPSIDSTPIIAWVKQNNPKVFIEGKFDKTKFPQGDPDARMGFMSFVNRPRHSKEQQSELFKPSDTKDNKRFICKFTKHNTRVCVAGFEMYPWGAFKERGRTRRKFVCPITHSKSLAEKHNYQCSMNHPKFTKGGCYAYVRVDSNDYRKRSIDPKSEYFKRIYRPRSGSERGFSRLLTFYMQRPMLTGINAVSNQCTLAHIAIPAIAITAVKAERKDKIRFIRGTLKYLLQK